MSIHQPMRKIMIEELMKEVQGPRYGVNEIISFNPWDEYLSGIVIPESWKNNLFEEKSSPNNENLIEIDEGLSEDSSMDEEIINFTSKELDPSSFIKSFGLSFTMDIPNPKFNICTTWGRYFKEEDCESAFDLKGNEIKINSEEKIWKKYSESGELIETKVDEKNNDKIWKRYSFGKIIEIEIDDNINEDETTKLSKNAKELIIIKNLENVESEKELEKNDGFVKLYIKRLKIKENQYTFSIYLINDLYYEQKKEDYHADIEKCLFQPSLRIKCNNEIKKVHIDSVNESEEELDFLYKDQPIIASGHMCSAIWKEIDYVDKINLEQLWPDYHIRSEKNNKYEEFLEPDIRSEFMPLYPVTLPNFDLDEDINIEKSDFDAEILANKSPNEIYDTLIKLPESYEKWINKNEKELETIKEKKYKITAKKLIEYEKQALKRIKNGIELIKKNDLIYTSFCFANKTISLQNKWGKTDKKPFNWRPFQIAFFLMNIEDIFDENSKNKDTLDLLWIPTGGGKTEAYLGLMAYTIALRRLKAYENNETGAGTSIISRYTLRLLTVQQFRRTLKMITATEYLRITKTDNNIGWRPKYSKINGNWIYGSTRFSAGLWVGGGVTPNHLVKDDGAMDILSEKSDESKFTQGEPAQILKCPVCGSWLSVPETGLNDKKNKLHIVIETLENETEINNTLNPIFNENDNITLKNISSKNHEDNFYTVSFEILGKFTRKEFEEEILSPINKNDYRIASLGRFNLGYFTSLKTIERVRTVANGQYDFEIWCTNPECELNNIEWHEGHPYPRDSEPDFPDGNYERLFISPFKENSRMPIPAYLTDDHIYNRCPTVVISTVDKIARLAFEPKAGALFGNVNQFNKYYGYNRDGMFPKGSFTVPQFNKEITTLKSPDLIIQDELHLIDGPLGSLFGLYEAIVSAIINKQGGNPKYIASTATISNAKKQVDLLFSKKLFQFPPHGLNMSNNYFVKDYDFDDAWNEDKAGRIYLGVYAPGKGPMTPQVRLWGRLIKTPDEYMDKTLENNIKNYWTTVGYYNSIKELGGALALYRDDIKNRLKNISDDTYRELNEDDKKELSSRISSTELPIILDNLERDGLNDKPKFDAIFTTSMFGTGVDVPHLSLMIMTSQPKTTGSYIQATGRIGRKKGGLVVDFFKAGRARDLNHYEMFSSFHSRINLGVEPVSVSPFSEGCMSRGIGPAIVAFLRSSSELNVDWTKNDGKTPLENKNSEEDLKFICNYIKERLETSENIDDENIPTILEYIEYSIKNWKHIAKTIENKRTLRIYEYYFDRPEHNVVLGDSGHEYNKNLRVVYKNAPQSLRDVEETIDFWV